MGGRRELVVDSMGAKDTVCTNNSLQQLAVLECPLCEECDSFEMSVYIYLVQNKRTLLTVQFECSIL